MAKKSLETAAEFLTSDEGRAALLEALEELAAMKPHVGPMPGGLITTTCQCGECRCNG